MASWSEFCDVAGAYGGKRVGANGWAFEVQGRGADRSQKVYAFHETMPPDLQFVQLTSAFAMIEAVDCAEVLRSCGQMTAGSIGYSPRFDANGDEAGGFLSLSTSVPLALLDLSEPLRLLLHINILAQAADGLEQRYAPSGLPDVF